MDKVYQIPEADVDSSAEIGLAIADLASFLVKSEDDKVKMIAVILLATSGAVFDDSIFELERLVAGHVRRRINLIKQNPETN